MHYIEEDVKNDLMALLNRAINYGVTKDEFVNSIMELTNEHPQLKYRYDFKNRREYTEEESQELFGDKVMFVTYQDYWAIYDKIEELIIEKQKNIIPSACQYCCGAEKKAYTEDKYNESYVYITKDNHLYFYADDGEGGWDSQKDTIKIKYCPFCGRKLD